MSYSKRSDKYTVYEYIFEQISISSKENSVIDIFCTLVQQRILQEIIYFVKKFCLFNKNLQYSRYR